MYFKAHLKHTASLCNIMGKSKEISQDIRKRIVDLHESGSSLGEISRFLKVPRSSVQTIIRKYKHHGNVQPSYRSGRRRILCPRDERALVRNVHINPRTKAKDLVKMLAEAGKSVSLSTVKRVLYRHGLKGHSARKKPLLQKRHKKARLQFANAHRDKDIFGDMSCGRTKLKLNCLAIMTIVTFGGKRGKLASLRTPSQL